MSPLPARESLWGEVLRRVRDPAGTGLLERGASNWLGANSWLSASSAAPRGRGAVEIAASSVVIHCCFTSLAGLEFLPLPWHQQLEVGELTSVSSRIRTTNQRVSPRQRGSGLEMGQGASSPEHSIASHSNPAQYSCGFPSTPKRVMLRDRCIPTAPGSDVQLARRGFEYR